MPLLLVLLLIVLIAQIGFWDTLGAVLGAVAMILLFILLLIAVAAIAGFIFFRRVKRRF